jgi:hypothetical protein
MNDMTLHATPRFRDVLLEQVRVVALAFRREALALVLFMGVGTTVVGIAAAQGTAASWFDSNEWVPVVYVAFLFSFAAWWRERPFESAFLWTFPVDRRRFAFAKVFAGWLWLMMALAAFTLWEKVLAIAVGVRHPQTMPFIAFSGATAAYLVGSALFLGLRHPLRWFLGATGLLFLLGWPLNLIAPLQARLGTLLTFEGSAIVLTYALLAAGLIALLLAISRHKETR